MKCPRCSSDMTQMTASGVTVDRCPQCGGILLDKGETETIDELDIGAAIDEPGAHAAPDHDGGPAHCHACDQDMVALTGAGDIEFDWCVGCERLFFDRGELAAFDAVAHD